MIKKSKADLYNKENELIIQIEQVLESFGIHKPDYYLATAAEQYLYMCSAILLAITNEEYQKELSRDFYTAIAKEYVSKGYWATTKTVEAGINAEIEYGWYCRNENAAEAWKAYFGIAIDGNEIKPSNFEFILTIATALRSKNKSN